MEEPTKGLRVPASIYERAEAIASERACSAESVILDALALHFGELPDSALDPDAMQSLEDEQLWALAQRRLTPKQDARLRDLLDLGNRGRIRSQDEGELAQLVATVDQQMVLRSKALVLLQRRGHDIDLYFESASTALGYSLPLERRWSARNWLNSDGARDGQPVEDERRGNGFVAR